MQFRLRGDYGILIRYIWDENPPFTLYELFNKEHGRVLATQNVLEFKSALKQLPSSAKVDFYDTCVSSSSRFEDKEVLRFCDELGLAGGFYVMCTDMGSTGKIRPWRWNRTAEQADCTGVGEGTSVPSRTSETPSP